MIATVVFLAEERVLKSVLVSDVGAAAVYKGAR